jgi:hypothetical protein
MLGLLAGKVGAHALRKLKRTSEELIALIKQRAAEFGPRPTGMTMLVYKKNDSWELMISPGKRLK